MRPVESSTEAPEPRSEPIRLLVVDDHDLFRMGVVSLLEGQPDLQIVGQASGGRSGVRLAIELQPDVVLMDLRMPDLDGVDATRAILAQRPDTRVVALSVAADDPDVAAAVRAGASGFVVKDSPIDEIAVAVRAAASGAAWLSPRAAEALLGRLRQSGAQEEQSDDPLQLLSARELDVLRLIARGMGNAEIARALGVSPRTAKNHVSSILSKLGLSNRIQAAVYAVRSGLT